MISMSEKTSKELIEALRINYLSLSEYVKNAQFYVKSVCTEEMDKQIEKENYESAAILRDFINEI